jgi:predicted  nucleic acid-binding Zn-ribbon protein
MLIRSSMQAKKIVFIFSVLLLFSGLIYSADASSDTTVSFRGSGVTIDLTFPEEAQPAGSVWHNATLTANTALYVRNFTVVIKAPVNSSWQVVFIGKDETNRYLSTNATLQWSMQTDPLPQDANGKLSCFMYLNTSQSTDYASYTFYTTEVREMTYSELLAGYNVLNNTYNQLLLDYETLNNTYNDLRASYDTLNSSYHDLLVDYINLNSTYYQLRTDCQTLNNTYNDLQSSYAALNSSYITLQKNYNELDSSYENVNSAHNLLLTDYGKLQSDFESLNSTFYSIQGNYTNLEEDYSNLQAQISNLETKHQSELDIDRIAMFIFVITVAALIVFIIYLKRKKEEPYVVIRKETVSMKSDKKS